MSARMHIELHQKNSEPAKQAQESGLELLDTRLESFLRNADKQKLLAPLRKAHAEMKAMSRAEPKTKAECQAALPIQEQWDTWLHEREVLRLEIIRGKEFLEQIRKDLTSLRNRLEEWPAYERCCGKNPLPEDFQVLDFKERIAEFLPGWLTRREERLSALSQNIEEYAHKYGLAA